MMEVRFIPPHFYSSLWTGKSAPSTGGCIFLALLISSFLSLSLGLLFFSSDLMSDTTEGDEEQSNTKWSKEIWTPQMEKDAPRCTAATRERAVEGSFSMGSMSQKLVLWGVPLARVWVQTASIGQGMQHVCDKGSPFHTALSVGTVMHTPHSTACHLGWCLDMYARAGYLLRTARQGLCILVSSALWPSTVYLTLHNIMSLPWPQVQILTLTFTFV